MLSETYESLQNEFELYRSSMEARIMKLSEKANRISKDKETYETTLEQLEHKYVDSVDIMKNTSKECLHLTNETNRLRSCNALREKRNGGIELPMKIKLKARRYEKQGNRRQAFDRKNIE